MQGTWRSIVTMLESLGESQKACMTNSSRPQANLKGKQNPDLTSVCSNYCPPNLSLGLWFNHLVLSTFRQCRSAILQRSAKLIAKQWLRGRSYLCMLMHTTWHSLRPCIFCVHIRSQKSEVRKKSYLQ